VSAIPLLTAEPPDDAEGLRPIVRRHRAWNRSSDVAPPAIHYLADHPQVGAQLAAWLHQQWPNTYTPEKASTAVESFKNRNRLPLTLVACEADLNPLGMVTLNLGTAPLQKPIVVLQALYVVPTHRRRGIGTELCRRAKLQSHLLGWRAIAVYATDREQFYHRLGWRTVMQAVATSETGNLIVFYMENHDPGAGGAARLRSI
jgi:predicted N-acetyltransferase YhbS